MFRLRVFTPREAAEIAAAPVPLGPETLARCRERLLAATEDLAAARAPDAFVVVCWLNDGVTGGATVFPELQVVMPPECGFALLFRPQVSHYTEPVSAGRLLVLRASYLALRRDAGA
jgi:hypothetical protein